MHMTVGKEILKGYVLPIYCSAEGTEQQNTDVTELYRFVHVSEGKGTLSYGGDSRAVTAPAICCFQSGEQVEYSNGLKCETVYFNPKTISPNSPVQSFDQKQQNGEQDDWFFAPFHVRDSGFHGVIRISHALGKQIARLIAHLGVELTAQRDGFWPCRSRSYFLELLILAFRAYCSNQNEDDLAAEELPDEIKQAITFLQLNYGNKVTIHDMVHQLHTNKTTLNEKFKKATGQSPIEYLTRYRIQVAR